MRHRRVDVLMDGHLLLDGALHAHQADAELVLEQLAHRAHAAVAEVVDVVDAADVAVQAHQVADDPVEVVRRQRLLVDRDVGVELDVELEAADPREVVALGVEEHAVEERAGALERRRVARAHAAVDLDQRFLGVGGGVLDQGVRDHAAAEVPVREEHLDREWSRPSRRSAMSSGNGSLASSSTSPVWRSTTSAISCACSSSADVDGDVERLALLELLGRSAW